MNNSGLLKRLLALFVVLSLGVFLVITSLLEIQVADGAQYRLQAERRLTRYAPEKASRGEILDRYGRPLVTNNMVFSARIDYVYWDKDSQNEILANLIPLLKESDAVVKDSLPIGLTQPFVYMAEEDSNEMEKWKKYAKNKKWGEDISAEAAMDKLIEEFEISKDMDGEMARLVAGVRYEMVQTQFSSFNSFTIASDISIELVSKLKEQHKQFAGVEIDVQPVREYNTDYAAHILGRVGPIFKDEYEELKEKGYPLNAIIGKDGVEKQFEEYLRGKDGTRAVETNISGKVTGAVSSQEPQPGHNVMLTIDIKLQEVAEKSLAATIEKIRADGAKTAKKVGADASGAAAVVIDVRSGEILALANYPTYSLKTFSRDFNDMLKDPLNPMLNRAIAGRYPPGSTFKPVTAVAGLEENIITTKTIVRDDGPYMFYAPSYIPACWFYNQLGRTHGAQNVIQAIKNSCNIFFYETGRLLGGAKIEEYASKFGLGQLTGVELAGEVKGNIAGPVSREKKGNKWTGGDTLGSAIGQSDHQFTPIQLSNYIATLVNGGTRYSAHLLKSVKFYDNSKTVFENTPQVVEKIDIAPENLKAVLQGMGDVASEGGTAAAIFRNYPIKTGGKTGSVQISGQGTAHGVYVGFAPFDNPQIAVAVLGENCGSGGSVAPVVRDIFDAYFGNAKEMDNITPEYQLVR